MFETQIFSQKIYISIAMKINNQRKALLCLLGFNFNFIVSGGRAPLDFRFCQRERGICVGPSQHFVNFSTQKFHACKFAHGNFEGATMAKVNFIWKITFFFAEKSK
jgi:hypothetical protein